MRRIVLALLGTVIGTTVLIGLKSPGAVTQLGLSAATPADPNNTGEPATGQPDVSLTPTAAGASVAASVPSAAAAGTTTAAANPPPAGAPTTTKPPTAAAPKTTAPPASRTILGPAVATVWNGDNYGKMQVKIVVTGKHIDSVVTVQQSNRPKTVSATLGAEALQKQSANLGNVSGATASSNAYKQSLQGAIGSI
jgi:uncharacterized protein with FMN-binding domain